MRYSLQRPDAKLVGDEFGHGPAVVLLHAGAERRRVWDPVAELLVSKGYRAITLDQRGHGESEGVAPSAALSDFVGDAEALRARVAEPALYVGCSLGGLAALAMIGELDGTASAAIAGLVLIDVVPGSETGRATAAISAMLSPEAAATPLVRDVLSHAPQLCAAASRVRQPTLLVRSSAGLVLARDADRLRNLMPRLREAWIEGAGHLVARDQPDALAHAVLEFLTMPEVASRLGGPQSGGASEPSGSASKLTGSASKLTGSAFEKAESLLRDTGAGAIPHLAGNLLEHLRRTELWLDRWQAPEAVRLAGLCHAAYGTDGFATALLDERAPLARAIGARAEAIVYRYAACDRDHFYRQLGDKGQTLRDRFTGREEELAAGDVEELVLLTLANELDVARHGTLDAPLRTEILELLRACGRHRADESRAALRALGQLSG